MLTAFSSRQGFLLPHSLALPRGSLGSPGAQPGTLRGQEWQRTGQSRHLWQDAHDLLRCWLRFREPQSTPYPVTCPWAGPATQSHDQPDSRSTSIFLDPFSSDVLGLHQDIWSKHSLLLHENHCSQHSIEYFLYDKFQLYEKWSILKITTNILPEGRKGRKKKPTKHKQTWYKQMQVSKDSKIIKKRK